MEENGCEIIHTCVLIDPVCVWMHFRMEVERAVAGEKLQAYLLERVNGGSSSSSSKQQQQRTEGDEKERWVARVFYRWMRETKAKEGGGGGWSGGSHHVDPILPQVGR